MKPNVLVSTKGMDEQTWLEYRNKGIGGSDVGTIMGLNKYKSAVQLWLEKSDLIEAEKVDNDAVHFGHVLEDTVAKEFERRTGKKVRNRNQILQHPEHPFMLANLDRVVVGEKALLECKTASEYMKGKWEDDEIPAGYLLQVMHYLAVTGYEKAYIAVLIGGNKFVWKEIDRDEELINIIIAKEKHFWEVNVLGGERPEIDGSEASTDLLKKLYPEANGEIVEFGQEQDLIIDSLLAMQKEYKELEKQIDLRKNQIRDFLGENEFGKSDTHQASWKNQTKNQFDAKTFQKDYPELAKKYTKQSKSRALRVK
ncbi:MAG: YqaJ viral recombinase family protein [Culicoidibacterales bacterium]